MFCSFINYPQIIINDEKKKEGGEGEEEGERDKGGLSM